eukprot:14054498-Heterocapsa_arctica.AAC.1
MFLKVVSPFRNGVHAHQLPVSTKKKCSFGENNWDDALSAHKHRGWRAIDLAGLNGVLLPANTGHLS